MIVRTILACAIVLAGWTSRESQGADVAARPNILFAIADDWGYGHASAYGSKWVQTPAFDRVARDGILFTRAYTPNAKCAPSRACLLTGRNSWQLKDAANHICYFPAEFKSWGEALADNGWFVGFTTKGWGPGVANNAQGQPRRMTGLPFNQRKNKSEAKSKSNNENTLAGGIGNADYAGNFEDFLAAVPTDKPWCFWYGAVEPHRDYEFGSGVKKGGKRLTDIDGVPGYWPDNDVVRNDMLDYALEVEHFDRHLGLMIGALEQRGLLDNTLVIVTSDHGMPFPRCKGNAYDFSNHVPLAAMWKRGIKGSARRVDDYVSFIDVAPTILEVAGIEWSKSGMAESPGKSLVDVFSSGMSGRVNPARDHVLIGMERHDIGRPGDVGYPIRGIVQDQMIYLQNFEPARWPACNPETGYLNCDGGATKTVILDMHRKQADDRHWALCFGKRPSEELYDLRRDPDCRTNLAGDPATKGVQQQLSTRLRAELTAQQDPRIAGRGTVFDQYPYANPAQRNFYERFMRGESVRANWVNDSDFEPKPLE